MLLKIKNHNEGKVDTESILESFQGWNAYAKWANTYRLREKTKLKIWI